MANGDIASALTIRPIGPIDAAGGVPLITRACPCG